MQLLRRSADAPPVGIIVRKQAIKPRPISADRALVPRGTLERVEESLQLAVINREALEQAHERRDVEGVLAAVRLDLAEESLAHAFQLLIMGQVETAALSALRKLRAMLAERREKRFVEKQVGTVPSFNLTNPRAVAYARNQSMERVKPIILTSKETLRQMVERSFREGRTADQLGRDIRQAIGLLPRQVTALTNFQARLVKEGTTAERIGRLTERYRKRLLTQRAKMIARTEIIDSSTFGRQELWRQSVEDGWIGEQSERKFVATRDSRLCIICAPMDGKRAVLGQPYENGAMGPPLHPQCRCTEALASPEPAGIRR